MKPEDITLRDYFAAHAPLDHTMLNNPKSVVDGLLTLARSSYIYADAMLIARQQPSPYEETSTPEVKPSPVESQEPQIDWSQAPEWANWWAMDSDKLAFWYTKKPEISENNEELGFWNSNADAEYGLADEITYTGDWKTSLRQRPQS